MTARETTFVTGTVVSSSFLNDRQDLEASLAAGVKVLMASATVAQVPVATDGSVPGGTTAVIDGAARLITAPYNLTFVPGTDAAGTYNLFITASGAVLTDGFTLNKIQQPALVPAGSRKVAEADWSGAALTAIRNMVDAVPGHAGLHAADGPDPLPAGSVTLAQIANALLIKLPYVGDLKFSLQTADHGQRPDLSYEWLLITGGGDGTGRLVDPVVYPSLYAEMGSPALIGGLFKLPPASGRALIAAGAGAGLTARALLAQGGAETQTLTALQTPPHTHGWGATSSIENQDHIHVGITADENVAHTHPNTQYNVSPWVQGDTAHGTTGTTYGLAPGNSYHFSLASANTRNDAPGHVHGFSTGGVYPAPGHANGNHSHTVGGATDGGSLPTPPGGQPHPIMDPWLALNCFVKT